jgi:hypothetical protein
MDMSEVEMIYTVTAGNIQQDKWRCWAWFASLEEAQRAVEGCGDFLSDNLYDVLVIEEVPRGAITTEYHEWWYVWNGSEWRPNPKPDEVDGLYHFGVG